MITGRVQAFSDKPNLLSISPFLTVMLRNWSFFFFFYLRWRWSARGGKRRQERRRKKEKLTKEWRRRKGEVFIKSYSKLYRTHNCKRASCSRLSRCSNCNFLRPLLAQIVIEWSWIAYICGKISTLSNIKYPTDTII